MTDVLIRPAPLPVGGVGHKGVGWSGMLCLIASEASIFAYLLFSYFYFATQNDRSWMPVAHPSLKLALPNTIVLLLSSVAVWCGERGAKQGRSLQRFLGFAMGILLGVIFVCVQLLEWRSKTFSLSSGLYGSIYFVTTGFHMAHVVVGLLMLLAVLGWSLLGYFNSRRNAAVLIVAIYWHFVDAVWLTVFCTFYLTPYLW